MLGSTLTLLGARLCALHANGPAHPLENPKYGPVPLGWIL